MNMATVRVLAKAINALESELNINRNGYLPSKDGTVASDAKIAFLDGQKSRLEAIQHAFNVLTGDDGSASEHPF